MLEIGTKAPDFTLLDQDGMPHKLSDYLQKNVILYFYPKDNTPGCTKQAESFSQLKKEFEQKNTIILGISKDSVSSHKKFHQKYNLSFDILSDEKQEVIKAYDVLKNKNMYGKMTLGVVRSTYLIDSNGIIINALEKVKASENASEMLALL